MNQLLRHSLTAAVLIASTAATTRAGDLKKDYFAETKPGQWCTQMVTTIDGTKSEYTTSRKLDDEGRVVVDMTIKSLEGPGAGSESRMTYFLKKDFNFEHDFLSHGKHVDKMVMTYGGTEMPIDATTLQVITESSKDFAGTMTFEASETVDGHLCDRYAYEVMIGGPGPMKETGKIWLDPTVAFGVVRQSAKIHNEDGTLNTGYELVLTGTGMQALDGGAAATPVEKEEPKPVDTDLKDAYRKGHVTLEVSVAEGSGGAKLQIVLRSTLGAPLTVRIPAGDVDLPSTFPVETMKLTFAKAAEIVLEPEASSKPLSAAQRGSRGAAEGAFSLSFYEDTPLYTGSVTMGDLPKGGAKAKK